MLRSGSRSFRTKLVLAAAATVALVQIVGALVDIYAGFSRLSSEMDVKGRLVVEQTSAAIARPLWDFDDALVEIVLRGLFAITDITRVTILTIEGDIGTEFLADGASGSKATRFYRHPIVVEDSGTLENLGTLEVAFSTAGLRSALLGVIFHKTILLFTVLTVASTALFVVLGRLSKPLEELRNAVYAIEREQFELPVPSRDRQDEIGALANALDELRAREAELAVFRRINTEKSRREGSRIQQALQSTRDAVVLIDETDKIIFINAVASSYFAEFSIGDTLVERRGDERSRADQIRSALLERREIDIEVSIKLQGSTRHFNARTGPIVDSEGTDLGGLFLASDFTEQFEHSREASYLASHDPLTGLLNRRQMDLALAGWTEKADSTIAVMLVDLDHFKGINDTLGHQLGDSLLVAVAHLLVELSMSDDLVIRLGGDEFAILTYGQNSERHLEGIVSRVISTMQGPILLDDRLVQTSISAGIACSSKARGDIDALMRHADLALYEAKKAGRGRYEIYKDQLSATHERRRKMEEYLQAALETDRVFPVFQVQTCIHDGSVVGFEALARWADPDLGMISPVEFIPLAESAQLIAPLTRKILVDACTTANEWSETGFLHRIAVNISPKLFDGAVLGLLEDCLNLTGCCPKRIELEITESVLLSNSSEVKKEIEILRSMGFSIALDDFGIGYSSLNYLRKFPVDKIKIDRTFVRNVASSAQSRAIVTAIAQLGHSLGMKVTGEGAETLEDRMALKGCGVDVIQGFVDGRPAIKSDAQQIILNGLMPQLAVN